MIREHIIDITSQTGLPLLVTEINDENVKQVSFEFVGTQCPHRRSRLNKIMFGKVEQVNPLYLQSWKIDDKASLVADSIPTKTLTYNVINYNGDYNIDNPGNKIPINYRDVMILFTFGLNVNGLWKYAPTKIFNLTDVSTSSEGIVTFTCGSVLDILTETFDHDVYSGPRTINEIMTSLLNFSGISTSQCILNNFSNYVVNTPLPESPVREIIQRLAFSCGATLTVDDENRIVFSQKKIQDTSDSSKFMFHEPIPFTSAGLLLEEPSAEALANTTNIGMYTYDSKVEDGESDLGSADISVITPTRITFSPTQGIASFDYQSLQNQHASVTPLEVYSEHAIIRVTWDSQGEPPIKVTVRGRQVTTTKTMPKTADTDTLLLDTGLAKTIPTNMIKPGTGADRTIFYYTDWYGAKFKYMCKTRNEYLVKAGDIILFETPFSDGRPIRVGYVLRNSYSNSEDSGEMEVITLGN